MASLGKTTWEMRRGRKMEPGLQRPCRDSQAEATASADSRHRRKFRASEEWEGVAGGSEPRERPHKDLVLLQGQWEATAGLLVVALVWFSVPERNTVMCTFDRRLWLQVRERTVETGEEAGSSSGGLSSPRWSGLRW